MLVNRQSSPHWSNRNHQDRSNAQCHHFPKVEPCLKKFHFLKWRLISHENCSKWSQTKSRMTSEKRSSWASSRPSNDGSSRRIMPRRHFWIQVSTFQSKTQRRSQLNFSRLRWTSTWKYARKTLWNSRKLSRLKPSVKWKKFKDKWNFRRLF